VARQDTLCPVARPAPRTASHRGCETRAKDSTSHLEPLLGTWELGNKPPSRSRGRAACAVVGRGRCEGHKESVGEEERRPPDLFDIDRGVVGEGQACLVDDALTLVGAHAIPCGVELPVNSFNICSSVLLHLWGLGFRVQCMRFGSDPPVSLRV